MTISSAEVWAEMGVPAPVDGTADADNMASVVAAINAQNPALCPAVRESDDPTLWDDAVTRGAIMLGARLFARRNSPTGVAAFSDAGPAYVARWDPDVERLLRIGMYAPPRVG